MNINGIDIKRTDKNTVICKITSFTNELKQIIIDEISSIARGKNGIMFSHNEVLREMLEICHNNQNRIKGMIGELLAHLLINKEIEDFLPLSCLMNLEEKSFKKGFDIVYYSQQNNELWYNEVKSGSSSKITRTPTKGTKILLKRAQKDMKSKFFINSQNLWSNAMNHAQMAANTKNINLIEILRKFKNCMDETPNTSKKSKNIILTSVLYCDISSDIDYTAIVNYRKKLNIEPFKNLIIFAIHKKTYQAIKDFINQEASK
ncbi:MAG: hypothetical protein J6W96_04670 [Alphaproteobacteria bacterium]|nr:hypothetical protein [Alphaproteobacteria bacterium]